MADVNKKYQDLEKKYISLLKQHTMYLKKYGQLQDICITANNNCLEYKNKYEAMGNLCMKMYDEASDLKEPNRKANQEIVSTIYKFTHDGYSTQEIVDIFTNARVSMKSDTIRRYINQYKACKIAKNNSQIESITRKWHPNMSKEGIKELIMLYKLSLV